MLIGERGGSADAVVVEHKHLIRTNVGGYLPSNNIPAGIVNKGNNPTSEMNGTFTDRSGAPIEAPFIVGAGESGVGKNMPPYIGVCAWRRIE